jgi:hypothetical protein
MILTMVVTIAGNYVKKDFIMLAAGVNFIKLFSSSLMLRENRQQRMSLFCLNKSNIMLIKPEA